MRVSECKFQSKVNLFQLKISSIHTQSLLDILLQTLHIYICLLDDLRDSREVAFQAALLYTSSRGERRIRVHTLCLPTSASVSEIINGADQAAVVGMLAKFAADRATSDSVADAKEGNKIKQNWACPAFEYVAK